MSFRDVIVQVDETDASRGRCNLAVDLASQWGATLTGVFLRAHFTYDLFAAEGLAYLPRHEIEAAMADSAAEVKSAGDVAEQTLRCAVERGGGSYEWRLIDGSSDTAFIAASRRSDLTILPPRVETGRGGRCISAATLALANGGPVLIVPEEGEWRGMPKRVVIAWKNTRESARALHDAWPFLDAAEEVTVVIVSPSDMAGADGFLERYMERHGCKAQVVVDHSGDVSVGKVLRRQVKALNADLLVMGLYGRSRLREIILGGVSREMLSNPPVPLLASH
jgi:nucleotide-binding universal stress UspA family protein